MRKRFLPKDQVSQHIVINKRHVQDKTNKQKTKTKKTHKVVIIIVLIEMIYDS